jgi:hypothetical protein
MREELKGYLDNIRARLRVDPSSKKEIIKEIYTHLEDKIEELCHRGLSEEEAIRHALQSFGPPQSVARSIYQVYSQGTWGQAFLAALPHLLFAFLFLFQLWRSPGYLLFFFSFTLAVVIFGWWHGKPAWLFPWLGYSLIPLIGFIIFLLSLPPWSYLALAACILLCWRLFYAMLIQAVKRDWLYGTLMLLPYPLIAGWFLALKFKGLLTDPSHLQLGEIALWIALSFVILGLTAIAFIRLGQNRTKVSALFTPELLILMLVALNADNFFGFLSFILLIFLALGFLLSPALLGKRVSNLQETYLD